MRTCVPATAVGRGRSPASELAGARPPPNTCATVPGASAAPDAPGFKLLITPFEFRTGVLFAGTEPVRLSVAVVRPCARPVSLTLVCEAAAPGAQVAEKRAPAGSINEKGSAGSPFEKVATTRALGVGLAQSS